MKKNQESTGMDSEEKSAVEENQQENTEEKIEENAGTENEQKGTLTAGAPVMDLPLEQFQDFNFVISNFYTIDKTTSINSEQLNAVTLLERDLRMSAGAEKSADSDLSQSFTGGICRFCSRGCFHNDSGGGRVFDDSASGYIRIQRHACDRHI